MSHQDPVMEVAVMIHTSYQDKEDDNHGSSEVLHARL